MAKVRQKESVDMEEEKRKAIVESLKEHERLYKKLAKM